MNSIDFSFENPWLLLILIPALAIILLPFLKLPKKRRKTFKKIAPVVIHSVVVCLLVLILSGFTVVKNEDKQSVMILVDLSDSTADVHDAILDSAEEILSLIDKDNTAGVLVFADDSIYSVELGAEIKEVESVSLSADATDIAAALEYAVSLMPTDTARRIILLSDGKQTDGDAESEAYYLATQGVRIDAAYFDTTTLDTPEVQIVSIDSPEGAYVADELTFSVELKSNVEGEAVVNLYDNGELADSINVYTVSGSQVFEMSCIAESAGTHEFRIELVPDSDTIEKNNVGYSYVNVAGESTVLIIADTISQASQLEDILSASCSVTTVTSGKAPTSMIELCNYDEIILLNVNYEDLPSDFEALLETYVGVYGRSLLTVGGDNTYMYGNMEGTLIEEMLPVTLSLSEDDAGGSVAIMLVLDCSSSMVQQQGTTYLSVAKQGALQCINALTSNDYVGIVSFNSYAYLKAGLTQATDDNKTTLSRTVSALSTSMGTYYTDALELAYEELKASDAATKHVIFLSDGSPRDYGYNTVVSNMYADGITVSTIGLVDTSSKSTLANMASLGGGEFYYVSSASGLPDIMLSETERVVVSSLIEGEYTPIITEASELTAGVEQSAIPTIYGYLGTTLKEGATAYLSTESGHPIYAAWQYGIGTVASYMSDLSGKWSSDWLANEVGTLLTSQMVETTVDAIHHDSSMNADISVRGKSADITVTTLGTATDHILTATVSSAGGLETYTLTQTSTGVYEGSIAAGTSGIYELMLIESDSAGGIVDYLSTAVAVSYSSEYDAFAEGGEEALTTICSFSGGKVTSNSRTLADVEMDTVEISLNPLVIFGIICAVLMITDITIRKVRWKDVKNNLLRLKARMKKAQ